MTFETRVVLCKPLNSIEVEVMQHLADSVGTKEIAAVRQTSVQTIKNYVYQALRETRRRQSRALDRGWI